MVYVHDFFTQLNSIVNIVSASCKRHEQLQEAQAAEIQKMTAIEELETDKLKGLIKLELYQELEILGGALTFVLFLA